MSKIVELVGFKTSNSLEFYVKLDNAVNVRDYYSYENYNLTVFSDNGVIESFLIDDTNYKVRDGRLFEIISNPCGTSTEELITVSMLIDSVIDNW